MITNDLKQIVLLHPVRINYQLSKHRKEFKNNLNNRDLDSNAYDGAMTTGGWVGVSNENVWDGVPFVVRRRFDSPIWRSIVDKYIRFRLLFNKPKKNPVDFFMEVKDNFEELKSHDIDEEKIRLMIENLEHTRQKHAKQTIVSEKNVQEIENKLIGHGFIQYQTEESLIKFIKQCKKGLSLKEIEDFERVIPEDVMLKFDKAEETKLFDNYYILYYDPSGAKNIYYTEEKDPIMFGVIRGSNKLYFIADWIDEHCNLTYKDILKNGVDYKLKK